jgi:hypothetical protein
MCREQARDESMVLSLATKAAAMARSVGAVSNPGKVACVMRFGRACGGGEGRSVHTRPHTARSMLIHFRLPVYLV